MRVRAATGRSDAHALRARAAGQRGPAGGEVRLAAARGHGVIYFYWEGLWGAHAGAEGGAVRRASLKELHKGLKSTLDSDH